MLKENEGGVFVISNYRNYYGSKEGGVALALSLVNTSPNGKTFHMPSQWVQVLLEWRHANEAAMSESTAVDEFLCIFDDLRPL
jgi:hypothetical protein